MQPYGAMTQKTPTYESHGAVLIVAVLDDKNKPLDRQSMVRLENGNTHDATWQTTADASEALFGELMIGAYNIEVSAVGYLTAHKKYEIGSAYATPRVEIHLQRDPSSVKLDESNLPEMPKKARKEVQRAVRALKSNDLKQARKHLDAAYKVAPESADINFFLGYLEFQERRYPTAQDYLAKVVTRDARNVQALTLLGRVRMRLGEYAAAGATLDEAVLLDPEDWVAHKLLAEASLTEHKFEKARDQSKRALEKGKGAGNSARLVLGQALANLGDLEGAISALEAYLPDAKDQSEASSIREFIARLKARASQPETASTQPALLATAPAMDDTELRLSVKTWEPRGVDESRPSIAEGVACPSEQVLTEAGLRVKQLADDIGKFAAIEELQHEQVDELGHAISKETRRYNYVASISEANPGYLEVEEYRLENSALARYPDNISSSGFTTLALVFHPDMQPTFEFTCEGLGEWHGQTAWLMHFRQRGNQPNRIHDMKIGGMIYPIDLKGRAWISADKFQIVHMESQLVKPLPAIQLLTEHQIVDYGPVQFKAGQLWLPSSAELYFDYHKHRYHRKHSFSHFMLFSTSSREEVQAPKQNPGIPQPNEETR
jgi:tetratricopeptide (TPR) repeat protein